MKKIVDLVTLKFLIVGMINTLVGTSVMFISYNVFHTGYWIASALNYIIGSIASFFLNKYFTFKSNNRSWKEVFRFILNISICYVIAYGFAKPCVYYLFQKFSSVLRDNVAMFTGMCLFVILNYFGQRFIVFKKEE